MKNIKIIAIISIIAIFSLFLGSNISFAAQTVKHILNIDTNLNSAVFDRSGIHIEGWKLANVPDTKLIVKIDNKDIDSKYIKYSYKYDLISIVKGYGTYKENPKPNFDIDIPTDNLSEGNHKLKIQFAKNDGTILETVEKVITIDKTVKNILNIDTNLQNAVFDKSGIHIEGWKLAKGEKSKLKVFIDDKEQSSSYINYSYKYDLISIVKGYGTYIENPKPNFDINIPVDNLSEGKHTLKIQFLLEDGKVLKTVQNTITIDKSIKHIMNIDTNLNNVIFNEHKDIKISGWKLATEANANLRVVIDGKVSTESTIKYSYVYDLISIVKGYGTYKENPKPLFDIVIETENLSKANHIIKIQHMSPDGKQVLESKTFTANYQTIYDGIDVSSFNGDINWNEVAKSGVHFAMIRLGYRGYRNPVLVMDQKALYNIREAKKAGIKVGIYFVTQATTLSEAQEEALWIIRQVHQNNLQLDYPIAIDTEDSGARGRGEQPGRADLLDNWTRTMVCRAIADVIKYYGYKPAIYANKDWFYNNLNLSELKSYDIWLAQYTNNMPDFKVDYEMWQYTSSGRVPGISANTDLNYSYKKY